MTPTLAELLKRDPAERVSIQISYNGKMPRTHSGISIQFLINLTRFLAKRPKYDVVWWIT